MSKKEKLLLLARRNPSGLSFADFETLLSNCSWKFVRQRGSHRFWYSPTPKEKSDKIGQPWQNEPIIDNKTEFDELYEAWEGMKECYRADGEEIRGSSISTKDC